MYSSPYASTRDVDICDDSAPNAEDFHNMEPEGRKLRNAPSVEGLTMEEINDMAKLHSKKSWKMNEKGQRQRFTTNMAILGKKRFSLEF
uniref:Uncharacterized protein n=1 Tax=Panagrolaimus sp. JU765 TaxID=591449 RepID=A0AC34QZE8_9BILA